ncbi:thiamine phosphate synthase [bacterium]|nr:MAG: thiamine phosphate synthase [bacterium]
MARPIRKARRPSLSSRWKRIIPCFEVAHFGKARKTLNQVEPYQSTGPRHCLPTIQMTFPKLLILTDSKRMRPDFDSALLNACLGGAKWFCVREKAGTPRDVLQLFARSKRIAEKFGAQTFLNGRSDIARTAHADGLHLPEGEIPVSAARLTLGFHTPCGVSVHSVEGAVAAVTEGANYLMFGPVFATQSHPDAAPVGLEALKKVVVSVKVPVFAVGGIDASNAASCVEAGAAGVAVISAVWDAPDITSAVRSIRAALGEKDAPLHGETHSPAGTSPLSRSGMPAHLTQSLPASDIILENGNSAH